MSIISIIHMLWNNKKHGGILYVHWYIKPDILQRYILYDSDYMTSWKSQNHRDNKKIWGCQGFVGRWREWLGEAQGIFMKFVFPILYDNVIIDT